MIQQCSKHTILCSENTSFLFCMQQHFALRFFSEKHKQLSIQSIPRAINGIALGNIGTAVMWLNLATSNSFRNSIIWLIYSLSLISLICLTLYGIRASLNPLSWAKEDLSSPDKSFVLGVIAMNICLFAVVSSIEELQLPRAVTFWISLIGAALQLVSMTIFVYQCITIRFWPEPLYNAAIHSCMFPVISIPGDDLFATLTRRIFLFTGLALLLPSILIQLWRVLRQRDGHPPVANNPSVAMMQAAPSISLTAWLAAPPAAGPAGPAAAGPAAAGIGHALFALSTAVYILTWYALWQRRHRLRSLGADPAWAAVTFPFVNTAIAAGQYRAALAAAGGDRPAAADAALAAWVWLLSGVATAAVAAVDALYFRHGLFLVPRAPPPPPPPPSSSGEDDIAAPPSCTCGAQLPAAPEPAGMPAAAAAAAAAELDSDERGGERIRVGPPARCAV
jgi:tellurite resistance protein TehA-like permease